MALTSNPFDFENETLATFLAKAVDDGTYNDIIETEKVDRLTVRATGIYKRAGELWSNTVDSFMQAVYTVFEGTDSIAALRVGSPSSRPGVAAFGGRVDVPVANGVIAVGDESGSPNFRALKTDAGAGGLQLRTPSGVGGAWWHLKSSNLENFEIERQDNTGTPIDTPLSAIASTGDIHLANRLGVSGANPANAHSQADDLVVGVIGSGNNGVTVGAAAAGVAWVVGTDTSGQPRAGLQMEFSDDSMRFRVANAQVLRLFSTQFDPASDNAVNLGGLSNRWLDVHFSGKLRGSGSENRTLALGDNNNLPAPVANLYRAIPDAGGSAITGFVAQNGAMFFFRNTSSTVSVTLKHDDAGSTAANRIHCPNAVDLVVPPFGGRWIMYDNSSSRWIIAGAVA